jgi:hypothetical protein
MQQELTIKVPGRLRGMADELLVSCRPCTHQSGLPWTGRVLGLTRTAIRLAVERRFEPGTILLIRAWGNWKDRPGLLVARVRQVGPLPEEEWETSYQLMLELDDADLQAFLRPPQHALAV